MLIYATKDDDIYEMLKIMIFMNVGYAKKENEMNMRTNIVYHWCRTFLFCVQRNNTQICVFLYCAEKLNLLYRHFVRVFSYTMNKYENFIGFWCFLTYIHKTWKCAFEKREKIEKYVGENYLRWVMEICTMWSWLINITYKKFF